MTKSDLYDFFDDVLSRLDFAVLVYTRGDYNRVNHVLSIIYKDILETVDAIPDELLTDDFCLNFDFLMYYFHIVTLEYKVVADCPEFYKHMYALNHDVRLVLRTLV